MISPVEIRRATFDKSLLNGYKVADVDGFLASLANDWDSLLTENQNLKMELEKAKSALSSYQDLENMMHKTLRQADETSKDTIENAKKEAEIIRKKAEQDAIEILAKIQEEKSKIEQELKELLFRRKDILSQMKLFLNAQLEKLDSYDVKEEQLQGIQPQIVVEKEKVVSFFDTIFQKMQPNPITKDIISGL